MLRTAAELDALEAALDLRAAHDAKLARKARPPSFAPPLPPVLTGRVSSLFPY